MILAAAVLVSLVFVVVLIQAKLRSLQPTGAGALYELRPALLTPAERSFAGALDASLPEGVIWFAKVRLADIFKPIRGVSRSAAAIAQNRIQQKHVDFLLVRSADMKPLAGIELDDSSHQEHRRQDRDAFVDRLFQASGLPLLRIPAAATYSPAELKTRLLIIISAEPN